MEEPDNGLDIDLIILISYWYEGKDERVLHFNLIDQDIFWSGFDVFIKEEWARNWAEEKHVQKDKENEESSEPLGYIQWVHLIVWVRVITPSDIDNEDHMSNIGVVIGKLIRNYGAISWDINYDAANQGEYDNY